MSSFEDLELQKLQSVVNTFTPSEMFNSIRSSSNTLSTVPIIPPEVITSSPLLRF